MWPLSYRNPPVSVAPALTLGLQMHSVISGFFPGKLRTELGSSRLYAGTLLAEPFLQPPEVLSNDF